MYDEEEELARFGSRAARQKTYAKELAVLQEQGAILSPLRTKKKAIATSFWAHAWLHKLQEYGEQDYALSDGRRKLREGALFNLEVSSNKIVGQVYGPRLQNCKILLSPLEAEQKQAFLGRVNPGELNQIIKNDLSEELKKILISPDIGLFPATDSLEYNCDCLETSVPCSHTATLLYGIAILFDQDPQVFLKLRGIKIAEVQNQARSQIKPSTIPQGIFNIDFDSNL